MVDAGSAARRFLNPWAIHLQRLLLQLKCPLCLNLFDHPTLLPCDHIFCKSCLDFSQTELDCPICHVVCLNSATRSSPHTENLIAVYKNMDATLSTIQQQPSNSADICSAIPTVQRCCTSSYLQKALSVSTTGKYNDRSYKDKSDKSMCSREKTDEFVNFERGSRTVLGVDRYDKQGDIVTEANTALQSAPDSPPSLGCPRDDYYSTSSCSEHTLQRDQTMNSFKDNCNTMPVDQTTFSQEPECYSREVKRQKMSLSDFSGSGAKSSNRQVGSISQKSTVAPPASKKSLHAKLSTENKKCAFCHSSKIAQKTGPMLHYNPNGVPVHGDDVNLPNIIHVHEICLNWAPQVYFKDEVVQNLKGEVDRGAKLKCSKCQRKGAALGCYEKSCKKTFHVMCAMEISECRWNLDDFLLLCPTHASLNFPHEKPHMVKTTRTEQFVPLEMSNVLSNTWVTSKIGGKPWLLCGSALTNDEKSVMMKFSTKHGVRVTKHWQPDVTHVIASTDVNGACCRTLKVLMGISYGIWIMKLGWINACLEAQCLVDEEPYEISFDNHGCIDGPKTGRLQALSNGPKIFLGLQFYFFGYFSQGFKRDLHMLLTAAGGSILSSAEELTAGREGHQTVIVYNLDPVNEGNTSNPGMVVQQRREDALNLSKRVGHKVVVHTWLLESIAACKLLPWIM